MLRLLVALGDAGVAEQQAVPADSPAFTNDRLRIGLRDTEFPQESAFAILFQNCPERQSLYERPSAITRRPRMSRRTLLSSEQRMRLFGIPTETAEMAKHYVLSAEDLALVRAKRRRE